MPPDFAIQLKFEEAQSPAHQQYKLWLTNASIISPLIEALNRDYYLPRPIMVRFRVCGQPNAFWEPKDAEVNMCYELLDRFVHLNRFRQKYAEDRRKNVLGMAKANRAFQIAAESRIHRGEEIPHCSWCRATYPAETPSHPLCPWD